jgi:ribosomal protein L37AE/L43A
MDIASISTAVSSVKTAIDIAKLLKDSADSFEKAEVKLQLAELISSLADAKLHIAEIQDALIESEKSRKALQDKLILKENMLFERPFYWIKGENESKDGPFCQRCYDDESKQIHLQLIGRNNDLWKCNKCANEYKGPNYVPYQGTSMRYQRI